MVRLGFAALIAIATTTGGPLKPPVIHEPFTRLPCPAHPKSTLALEGCYEKAIVTTDRKIDMQAGAVFRLLRSRAVRVTFVRGERSWLAYRHDSCAAASSHFAGGSFAPVSAAICILDRSKAHLRDLVAMRKTLTFH
jgi:uncharacterized protein YecT (DUF1311 family)